MSETQQDDRIGARLDETREAIEALWRQLDNSRHHLERNPQLVFRQVLPPLYAVLSQMLDTIVLLDYRLNQIEKR